MEQQLLARRKSLRSPFSEKVSSAKKHLLARNLAEKLLTYGTGEKLLYETKTKLEIADSIRFRRFWFSGFNRKSSHQRRL